MSDEQHSSPAAATKQSTARLENDAPRSPNTGQSEIEARGEPTEDNAEAAIDYDSSGDETEAYETAFSKLQKIQCKYDATLGTAGDDDADSEVEDGALTKTKKGGVPSLPSHKSRRRRAGYGGNKSSLEALSTRPKESGDSDASPAGDDFNLKDIEDDEFQTDNNLANGLSANDEFPAGGTQDNSEGNIENDSDDDDATNPYVAEDEVANNMSEDDSSEVPLSDDEHRPRGRTKRTKSTAMKPDEDAEEGKDDTEDPQDDDRVDEDDKEEMEPAADDVVMHEELPESAEGTVQPEPSQDDATTTVQEEPQQGVSEPSDEDVLRAVNEIYNGIEDKDLVTVGDVKRPIAKRFGWEKCPKPIGKLIKQRLTDLINGIGDPDGEASPKKKKKDKSKKEEPVETNEAEDDVSFEGDQESESEASNGTSSEYEESKPARKSKKGSKSKRRKAKLEDSDDGYGTESSIDEPKKKSKRSSRRKRRSSSGKMAKHLRDNASRARERQLEEARIRKEELGHLATDEDKKAVKNEEGHQVSEQDKERLQAISARFDTNRDELLIRREEDRVGLIGLLRQRRLQIISSDTDAEVKVESDSKAEVGGPGQPRLTSTTNLVKVEASAAKPDPVAKSKTMIDLGSESSSEDDNESESDDDDDDNDDLEIIPSAPAGSRDDSNCQSEPKKKHNSTIDAIFSPSNSANAIRQPMNAVANPRMALRNALKAKQLKAGNRWLARELGYKTEADHIRDCKEAEHKKRQQILLIETEMARRGESRTVPAEVNNAQDDEDEELDFDAASSKEDDEMAVAREMGQLEESGLDDEGADGVDEGMDSNDENNTDETANVKPEVPNVSSGDAASLESVDDNAPDNVPFAADVEEPTAEAIEEDKIEESTAATTSKMVVTPSHQAESSPNDKVAESESGLESGTGPNEVEAAASTSSEPVEADNADEIAAKQPKIKKKKNSAWKALLEKEKLAAAKQKRLNKKGGTLVDGEAEEEEEEEGIVGLEDFGFAVQKKDDDDDESVPYGDDLGEDDVVDDLSDGEGDEEAGEVARMAAEAREEKERHKEILRRMREGYDGRRGGIASGSARGMLRFDQLVAADNRDDAKRLGLLNDDELNSDDDEADGGKTDGPDIEEDEAAMLDKMLKDRFLNKDENTLEENFSDEESEDEADQEAKTTEGNDEEDEREQERLAKRFAKRARMNRILEQYEGDSQFSRSRLIDEDESTQHDLKTMKTSLGTKRGIRKENSNGAKKMKIYEDSSAEPASLFIAKESSLSVALAASRVGRKRKTTFTSGKAEVLSRKNSSSSTRVSVASSHVFVSSESQSQSGFNSSNMSYLKKKRDLTSTKSGGSLLSKVMSRSKSIGFRGN